MLHITLILAHRIHTNDVHVLFFITFNNHKEQFTITKVFQPFEKSSIFDKFWFIFNQDNKNYVKDNLFILSEVFFVLLLLTG